MDNSRNFKKPKIVFVSPIISQEELYGELAGGGSTEALLGICYLAAITKSEGLATEIVDMPALNLSLNEAANIIASKKPDYVGFTAVSLAVDNAAKLASILKNSNPSLKILIGGSHITAEPEQTFAKYECFDVGIIGEGEDTIIRLLKSLENGNDLSSIRGIVFRRDGNIFQTERNNLISDLDSLPMPAWNLLPDIRKHYKPTGYAVNRFPSFSLVTSRGCSFKCTFCDRSVFGNRYRKHSPEYIIEMMKDLIFRYGIRDIRINDDEFMLDKNHVKNVCSRILKEKLDISWSCLGRVDDADEGLLRIMKRAGCWQIRYGIESGSQEVLNAINKKISLQQIENAVSLTRKVGIKTIGFFMMGLPTETEKDLQDSVNFALKLELDDFKINYLAPFPGSQIHSEINKYGSSNLEWSELHMHKKPTFIPFGLTEDILVKYNRLAFKRFYMRPKIIFHHLLRMRNLGNFFASLKGFLSLFKYTLLSK